MKKVGIVTFYDAKNYGAFLQCFATQKALSKKFDASIINYSNKEIRKSYSIIKPNNIKKTIKSLLFLRKNLKRNRNFKDAIKNHLILTSLSDNYDVVIAGSDQIWNIELTGGYDEVFSLELFENAKKISYASSIGKESLITGNKEIYTKILSGLDNISVREESTKELLSELTNKNIKVNLDPTLLLTKEEWEKYTLKNTINSKYIFSYFVAVTQDNYDALKYFSDKLNMPVLSYSENPKEKNILKNCYSDGPFEFITNIKNANYIFTSSFHGVVFSILFNKQFICMIPKEKANRIINLLDKLNLSDRIIKNIDDLEKFDYNKKIDYSQVNKSLNKLREESIEWINEAIGD